MATGVVISPGDRLLGTPRLDLRVRGLRTGGMGYVAVGPDACSGAWRAVKVPRAHAAALAAAEARLWLAIPPHPNIVRARALVTLADATPGLVLDYLPGATLRERLRGGRWSGAARALREVAAALVHLHDLGITHGDLKPENILFDAAGHAAVTDFGLARAGPPDLVAATAPRSGTPPYMAPERWCGAAYGPAADIYSFGQILAEVVTGAYAVRPVGVPSLAAWRAAHCAPRPAPPPALTTWVDLCARCLAPRPVDRLSARAVAAALADLPVVALRERSVYDMKGTSMAIEAWPSPELDSLDPAAARAAYLTQTASYLDIVTYFVARRADNPSDCEEIVQDFMPTLPRVLERYRGDAPVRGYLATCVRRFIDDYYRRRARHLTQPLDEESIVGADPAYPAATISPDCDRVWFEQQFPSLRRILQHLRRNAADDQTISLFFDHSVSGIKYQFMAEHYGRSPAAIENAIDHFKRRLSADLRKRYPDLTDHEIIDRVLSETDHPPTSRGA